MPGKNPGHPEVGVPENGETVFFSGATLGVLGTETQRRRKATMARLKGTGKDPLGRYGEGEVFDVPETDSLYKELIDKGYAEAVAPEDDPARSKTQIADAMVSGQSLADPVDQKIAEEIGNRAHDIVQTGDPDAKQGDAGLDPPEHSPPDSKRVSPDQVTASSRASADPEGAAKAREKADEEARKQAKADERAAEKAEKAEEAQATS